MSTDRPQYEGSDASVPALENVRVLEGGVDAPGVRVGIVATRWNESVINGLLQGALETLAECQVADKDVTVIRVPGAFEVPITLDKAAGSGQFDVLVALAAVVRGDTPHFDYVAGACTDGLVAVVHKHEMPIAFGVLTTDNQQQAEVRAAAGPENKGREAVHAVLQTWNTIRLLHANEL